MLTILAALGSVIFALLALVAHFWEKSQATQAQVENQAVKDQVSANDAKIKANQEAIDQEKANLAEREKNETNQSIIDDLNSRK